MILTAKIFSICSSGGYEVYPSALMIAPSVFFGCVTAAERGYYEGMCNMYPTAVSQAIEGGVKTVSGLILCVYADRHSMEIMEFIPEIKDSRAIPAAAGILGVTLSTFASMVYFAVMRIINRNKTDLKGEEYVEKRKNIIAELMRNAMPVGISAVVTNLTALIDMYTVIGWISVKNTVLPKGITEAELPQFVYGSYVGIALTLFNIVPSVTNMLGKGILPIITETWENSDMNRLKQSSSQALLTASVISVPCAVGIMIIPEQILDFLFYRQPDEVSICVNSLRILMIGMVCLCLSFPVFSMLQAIGKASAPLKIMLTGTAVKLAGNMIFIPRMGIDGAAVSTSLCYVVILTVSLAVFICTAKIKIEYSKLLAVAYSGAMCGGAAWLTKDIALRNGAENLTVILISAASGGIFYIISVWLSLSDIKKSCCKNTAALK